MPKKPIPLITILVALLLFAACHKSLNLDNWTPKVLGPLVNGYATIEEVSDLRDKIFHREISPGDLHFENYDFNNYTGNVPAMFINHVGPFPYQLSDYFHSVFVDSADFVITIHNTFPIAISRGTYVVFRTQPDTLNDNNIVLKYKLPQDIAANGIETFETLVRNTYVSDTVYLYLDSLQTPATTNVTFSGDPTELTFQIKFLNVFNIALNVEKTNTVLDTTSVSITDNVPNTSNDAATGIVRVFLSNGMPIKFNFQMYFYDENMNFIDSLYHGGDMNVNGAHTNLQGALLDSAQAKYETTLDATRIGSLKSAKKLVYRLTGDTYGYPPPYDWVGDKCFFHVLLTGDLKIKVAKFL